MEHGRAVVISPLMSVIATTAAAAIFHDNLSLDASEPQLRPSPPRPRRLTGSDSECTVGPTDTSSKTAGSMPFVVLDESYSEAVRDTSTTSTDRIGAVTLPLVHAASHLITQAFEQNSVPTLTDWNSTGGAYFLNDTDGRSIAVIKPEDEEPYAINNPKKMGSLPLETAAPPSPPIESMPDKSRKHPSKRSRKQQKAVQSVKHAKSATTTSGPKAVQQYIRRGIFPGEGAAREVAAYLLDHDHQAGVPPTALVLARHTAFNVSDRYVQLMKEAQAAKSAEIAAVSEMTPGKRRNSSVASGGFQLPIVATAGVPTLVQYALPPVKAASLQLYVPHACSAEDVSSSLWPVDEVHKIAILDIRLGNTDRNDDNVLVRALFPGDAELADYEAEQAAADSAASMAALEASHTIADKSDSARTPVEIEYDDDDDAGDYDDEDDAAYELEEACMVSQHRRLHAKRNRGHGHVKGWHRGSKLVGKAALTASSAKKSDEGHAHEHNVDARPLPFPTSTLLHYWRKRLNVPKVQETITTCEHAGKRCSIVSRVLAEAARDMCESDNTSAETTHTSEKELSSPSILRSSVPFSQYADTVTYPILKDAMADTKLADDNSDATSLPSTGQGLLDMHSLPSTATRMLSREKGVDEATSAAVASSLAATLQAIDRNRLPATVAHSVQISAMRGAMTPMLASVNHALARRMHSVSIESSGSTSGDGMDGNFVLEQSGDEASHPALAMELASTVKLLQGRARTVSVPNEREGRLRGEDASISCIVGECGPLKEEVENSSDESDASPSRSMNASATKIAQESPRSSSSGTPKQMSLLSALAKQVDSKDSSGFPLSPTERITACKPSSPASTPPITTASPAQTAPKPGVWRSSRLEALRAKEREEAARNADSSANSGTQDVTKPVIDAPPLFSGFSLGGVSIGKYESPKSDAANVPRSSTVPSRSSPLSTAASPSSMLSLAGRACDVDNGSRLPDVRSLKAAKKLELVPIDHGLCLPHVNALDDINCSWMHWRQAKEPLSEARKRYVLNLDGRADTLLLYTTLGERIRPACLLTLRVCTALLQEGVKAGLTLADIGMMMSRDTGVGVIHRRESFDAHADEDFGSVSNLSALEQAYRKAKAMTKRERKGRHKNTASLLQADAAADEATRAKTSNNQRKLPWNVPSRGPKKKAYLRAMSEQSPQPKPMSMPPEAGVEDVKEASPLSFLHFHDAVEANFRVAIKPHIAAVLTCKGK